MMFTEQNNGTHTVNLPIEEVNQQNNFYLALLRRLNIVSVVKCIMLSIIFIIILTVIIITTLNEYHKILIY